MFSANTKPGVCFPGFYFSQGSDVSCDVTDIKTPSYGGQGASDANVNPAVFSCFSYFF